MPHTCSAIISNPYSHHQLKPSGSFLGSHITETHDLWHTVTGSKTDIYGEIQLEAFYVAQLEVSKFWLALLTKNLLKSLLYDLDAATSYMAAISKGWGRWAKQLAHYLE